MTVTDPARRALLPPAFWELAICALVLLWSGRGLAIELQVKQPPPTEWGDTTAFAAELSDISGDGEVRWDFGDGTQTEFSSQQLSVEHRYESPGHYAVIVVARDEAGFTSRSFAHTVHTRVTEKAPRTSSSLAHDTARQLLAVANPDNDSVTLIDTERLEKRAEIAVCQRPVAVAFAPDDKLWVVCRDHFALAILDVDEQRLIDVWHLPYASQPMGIVFDAEGNAYVPLHATGEVLRIDGATHAISGRTFAVPHVRGIAITGNDASLWVTRFLSPEGRGEVVRMETRGLEVAAHIELLEDTTTEDTDQQGRGLPNYLFSPTVTPDGSELWVPSKKDNMARGLLRDGKKLTQDNTVRPLISVLDVESNEELPAARMDLDDRNLPRHVTFSPLGDYAFISVFGSNLVEVRDTHSHEFVTALANAGRGPQASVLDEEGRLFIHGFLSRSVVVYDASDLLSGADQATQRIEEINLVEDETLSPAVLRGKQIFADSEDPRMAQEGYLSCSSCHFEGFEDGRVWEFSDRGEGLRNTTSLLGRRGTGHGPVHWTGNFDEIQDFEGAIRSGQGGLGFLTEEQFDEGTRSEPLGDPKAGLDEDLDALAAYVSALDRVPPSPHRNQDGTLTRQAEAGQQLFLELGCDECHSGEEFTDSAPDNLHDVGTISESSGARLWEELTGIDTPTLLGIWQTAPYLHDGSAPTLRDVLVTNNPEGMHGDVASLSENQIEQLIAYLLQLDQGGPVEPLPQVDRDGSTGAGGAGGATGSSEGNGESAGCACRAAGGTGPTSSGLTSVAGTLLALLLLPSRRCRRVHGLTTPQHRA